MNKRNPTQKHQSSKKLLSSMSINGQSPVNNIIGSSSSREEQYQMDTNITQVIEQMKRE